MGGDQASFNFPNQEGIHDLYLILKAAGARPITGLVSLQFNREAVTQ